VVTCVRVESLMPIHMTLQECLKEPHIKHSISHHSNAKGPRSIRTGRGLRAAVKIETSSVILVSLRHSDMNVDKYAGRIFVPHEVVSAMFQSRKWILIRLEMLAS
jgi:hypothetical protein